MKIFPLLGLGFSLGLSLELGLRGGQFSSGAIVLEPFFSVSIVNNGVMEFRASNPFWLKS